jgi:maltooligosyltrehalose trehalohydrolase
MYRALVRLRKEVPALASLDKDCLDVWGDDEKKVVFVSRWRDNNRTLALYNFNATEVKLDSLRLEEGMERVLDSSEETWNGPGSLLPDSISNDREMIIRPWSFALYVNKL